MGRNKMAQPTKNLILVTSDTYKQDALNLLCLQKGMKYRFRYRQDWVPNDLLDGTVQLKNMKGIIVFFDNTTKQFFPIMQVQIENPEQIGDVLHVEFSIGSLVTEQVNAIEFDSTLKNFIKGKYFDEASNKLSKYIFLTEDLKIGFNDDISSWVKIFKNVSALTPFKDSVFLKILKITNQKGESLIPKQLNKRTYEVGYELKSHSMYKVEIFQRTRNDFPSFRPFKTSLSFIPNHIVPIKDSDMIVGKYDKLQLAFFTKWTKSDLQTVVGVKSEWIGLDTPEVYIPLKVLMSKNMLAGSMAAIVSGVALAIAGSNISFFIHSPNFVVGPLLSVLGAAIVALGVAWLRPMYE
jgi:hypothetical protein